ncbi:unnamed protein product [Brassica oleracea var. botrytis]|uniref:BnaCnng41040D protein n=1 Tax=Brassica napus TaxID=3708 RepID=A0A078JD70_BRANA|nr:BnaCnng41040D [Brassica napus]
MYGVNFCLFVIVKLSSYSISWLQENTSYAIKRKKMLIILDDVDDMKQLEVWANEAMVWSCK